VSESVIMDAFVDLFITLCIISNTAFMACDHANIEPHFASVKVKVKVSS